MSTKVYLAIGSKKTFACALDWPGWCRSGKTEQYALDALAAYASRRIAWHVLDHAWEIEDRS